MPLTFLYFVRLFSAAQGATGLGTEKSSRNPDPWNLKMWKCVPYPIPGPVSVKSKCHVWNKVPTKCQKNPVSHSSSWLLICNKYNIEDKKYIFQLKNSVIIVKQDWNIRNIDKKYYFVDSKLKIGIFTS